VRSHAATPPKTGGHSVEPAANKVSAQGVAVLPPKIQEVSIQEVSGFCNRIVAAILALQNDGGLVPMLHLGKQSVATDY